VSAPPEAGKANAAVLRLLADTLALPLQDLSIVSGQSSRDKVVELAGIERGEIDFAEVERRLAQASGSGKDIE
jgi:uncharacterized protein YggU (UPF0235/DUF167 family)